MLPVIVILGFCTVAGFAVVMIGAFCKSLPVVARVLLCLAGAVGLFAFGRLTLIALFIASCDPSKGPCP